MPKLGGMAQLSRPFQIALLALGVFVLAWFAVLHRPGGASTGSSSPSVSSSAGSSSASASGSSPAGGSSSVYHGSAPGVEGLSKDINKAHGAVAASEHNAQALQSKSAQASGEAAGGGTPSAASHRPAGAHTGATVSTPASTAAGSHTQTHASTGTASASKAAAAASQRTPRAHSGSAAAAPSKSAPPLQAAVAGELKQGKVVLLLFWNPRSSDDAAVDRQVRAAAHKLGRSVAVHTARARQVDSFGSITRDIQIYQTPTLLIVNPHRQVTTMTGYTDAFAIEQAVAEARK